MADEILAKLPGNGNFPQRFKDMGDGTWAEVVYASGSGGGGGAVTQSTGSSATPWYMIDGYGSPTANSWTSATTLNTAVAVTTSGYDTVVITLVGGGTLSGGAVTFEVFDGAAWIAIKGASISDYTTSPSTVSLTASMNKGYQFSVAGFPQFRIRLSTVITAGTLTATTIVSSAPDVSLVTVGLDPANPLPAGTNILGSMLGRTSKVAVSPTLTASSAYTVGNVVGGLMTFANVFDTQQSGVLQSIRIRCKSVQTAGFKLYLFTTQPTNSTWTDKAAPAINSADIAGVFGPFILTTADSGLGTETTYELDGIGAAVLSATTGLYGVLTTLGTPTFTSTSDLTVELNTIKD